MKNSCQVQVRRLSELQKSSARETKEATAKTKKCTATSWNCLPILRLHFVLIWFARQMARKWFNIQFIDTMCINIITINNATSTISVQTVSYCMPCINSLNQDFDTISRHSQNKIAPKAPVIRSHVYTQKKKTNLICIFWLNTKRLQLKMQLLMT